MTKPRFTPEQHTETGRQLAFLRDQLVTIQVDLLTAYPKSSPGGQAAARIRSAVTAIDSARCTLDGALYGEHPNDFTTTTYYPHPEDRALSPKESENAQ